MPVVPPATTVRGRNSGAGLASAPWPILHALSVVLLQTTISVVALAVVLRVCAAMLNGMGIAATQALHVCVGMPTTGNAETSLLQRQPDGMLTMLAFDRQLFAINNVHEGVMLLKLHIFEMHLCI